MSALPESPIEKIYFDFSKSIYAPTITTNSADKNTNSLTGYTVLESGWYNKGNQREAQWQEALTLRVETELFPLLPVAVITQGLFGLRFTSLKVCQPTPGHIIPIHILRPPSKEELKEVFLQHHK